MTRLLRAILAGSTVLAVIAPTAADPGHRDLDELILGGANRYVPHEIGKPVDLHYLFGPYVIPPGQDSNRITVDLPIETGYVVAIAPDLVDATSGRIPTQQEAHIHHAHWFRVTDDPDQEYYTTGLSWVFGTGEEKSQGRLDDRARLEPENLDGDPTNDFTYGIFIDGTTPQTMIYMIHNKLASVGTYFVVLDVTFIPGTRAQIKAAPGGKDIRALYGQLWGQTKDETVSSKAIGARWTVTRGGVAVAAGSHVHPGGKTVVVSNVGPDTDPLGYDPVTNDPHFHPLCEGLDPDKDGWDGVAILNSYKYDRDMDVAPYSENYQMGVTKFGWRAPVHKGDVLVQNATYAIDGMTATGPRDYGSRDVLDHHWYEAMSYTGIYMDREQSPSPKPTACTLDAFAPHLLGNDTFAEQGRSSSWMSDGTVKPSLAAADAEIGEDYNLFLPTAPAEQTQAQVIQGMVNHIWQNDEPLCAQPNLPALVTKYAPCGPADIATEPGPEVTSIHVAGFKYLPGDLGLGTARALIPRVRHGTTLTFVNEDAALNVRHTFTSCAWPCVGTYVSNFPLPNGGPTAFDTGKIGNLDYIDGGLQVERVLRGEETDTVPYYEMTVNLPAGKYSYFCRIHPFMRGAFEVIPA